MKRFFSLALICVMLLCAVLPAQAESPAWQAGDTNNGFTVTDVRAFDLIGADAITLRHDKTGALVMLLLNEDTNRVFNVTFRTVAEDNTGTPHVFEHATLSGSEKYPSKKLFFNLSYQTYNTYMNAGTYPMMTSYPIGSLSEDQLLKYADFYLDSCFYPMIQTDESIFRREAWRYSLTGADEPMTLTGTVYNEMKGAMTLESAANYNYKRTLAPGSVIGNVSGGEPASIPDMTWDALRAYHDTYYHPSNSLSFVYGKIEHPEAFLALLDGVFSAYEARDVSDLFADADYRPLTEAAEKVYSYPVEAGTDTANGAAIYYGFRCDGASDEDLDALDLFTTMANADSGAYKTLLKERLPMASGSVYIDLCGVPNVYFCATGVNASDADAFRAVVDESMAKIAEEGFTREEAEALVMRGEPAVFDSRFMEFGVDCVKAKAIDDRIGCAVMLELLKNNLPYDTYFAFVVGEEIGSRGATVAGRRIQPGCVMVIEGTTAADMPDVAPHKQSCRQRQGAVVSLMDSDTVYSREFREKMLKAADEKGVKWQYRKSANGGTDAGVGTTSGPAALAFGLSAPVRYIHCACNVAYLPDLEEVRKLAEIVIEEAGELDV